MRSGRKQRRRGVIMIVVLGMLTLFTLLAVSYLVFARQSERAASYIADRETRAENPQLLLDLAIKQVIRGNKGPGSAFWGHDLLGDYYGYKGQIDPQTFDDDGVTPNPASCMLPTMFVDDDWRPAVHLAPAASWSHRYVSCPTMLPSVVDLRLDDQLNGRVLTFTEGPLKDLPLTIIRYFGDHGAPSGVQETRLTGRVVLDVGPHLNKSIEVYDDVRTLEDWLALGTPSVLFYEKGPDSQWGNSSNIDAYSFAARSGCDDTPLKFYINAHPLNGYGMGWAKQNPGAPASTTNPYNLNQLVNQLSTKPGENTAIAVSLAGNYNAYLQDESAFEGIGGDADEPFDVADYNNLFLGYFPIEANTVGDTGLTAPSFVRPAVINYILNYYGVNLSSLTVAQLREIHRLLQQTTPRHLPVVGGAHASFTGSNLGALATPIDFSGSTAVIASRIRQIATALATGPWDVDCDGDGINDSVWVDVGLPIMATTDGSQVKPMVAIRIEDLGGRVDINRVGRHQQFAYNSGSGTFTPFNLRGAVATSITGNFGPADPKTTTLSDMPSGFGYGPAEISLQGLFPFSASRLLHTRFGNDRVPGQDGVANGISVVNDINGLLRNPGRPQYHTLLSSYGLPLDTWGRSRVAMGPFGHPIIDGVSQGVLLNPMPATFVNEQQNDLYEMAARYLSYPDSPYTESDFEALLNRFDLTRQEGSTLVSAIATELDARSSPPVYGKLWNKIRRGFSVHSASIDLPPASLNGEWRASGSQNQEAALTSVNQLSTQGTSGHETFTHSLNAFATSLSITNQQQFWAVVAPELRRGEKFNLNRLLGNGIADDGNGTDNGGASGTVDDPFELATFTGNSDDGDQVVDDPHEVANTIEPLNRGFDAAGNRINLEWTANGYDSSGTPIYTTGDLTPETASRNTRDLFVRHLYCMAMFALRDNLNDRAFDFRSTDDAAHPASELRYRAWKIAQWAVNVVDFRDGDGIMTGFEFDVNPFDGWDVDGDLSTTNDTNSSGAATERGVVWGMESPELLLTEHISFHDRRVKDTTFDSTGEERLESADWSMNPDGDDDTDQIRIPQGSTYLELFCARSPDTENVSTTFSGSLTSSIGGVGPSSFIDSSLIGTSTPPMIGDSFMMTSGNAIRQTGRITGFNSSTGEIRIYPAMTRASANGDTYQVVPETSNPWAGSPELYARRADGSLALRLSAAAPDGNPVWRIGITPSHASMGDEELSPLKRLTDPAVGESNKLIASDVETFVPQVDTSSSFPYIQDPAFKFDRVVWMTSRDPATVANLPDDSKHTATGLPMVYNSATSDSTYGADGIVLGGGQYAVIGPRPTTYIGSRTGAILGGGLSYADYSSQQRIELSMSQVVAYSLSGTRITPSYDTATGEEIRSVVGIYATAAPPVGWANTAETAPDGIGLSISEPHPWDTYYDEPTNKLDAAGPGYPTDAYYDFVAGTGTALDEPLDQKSYAPLKSDFDSMATGTRDNYKTAYLQRLADPTVPYHASSNPYITVDWIPMDLTVFNGEETNEKKVDDDGAGDPDTDDQWIDPSDVDPFAANPRFASRYKNGEDLNGVIGEASGHNNIWSLGTRALADSTAGGGAYFDHNIVYDSANPNPNSGGAHSFTLGYLNQSFGPRWIQNPSSRSTALQPYVGAPKTRPFPWITWFNRPFASPYELMLVPTTSAGRIMLEFSTPAMTSATDPYQIPANWDAGVARAEFGHLFNYFATSDDFPVDGMSKVTSPNLGRILDWVATPNPYDYDNELMHSQRFPSLMAGTWPPTTGSDFVNRVPFEIYRAPFNWQASNVRRGRLNLNSIHDMSNYLNLMQGYSTSAEQRLDLTGTNFSNWRYGAFWSEFLESRRGYTPPTSSPESVSPLLDRSHATQFAGAFKPTAMAGVTPVMVTKDSSTNAASYDTSGQTRPGTSVGLLRKEPGTSPVKALFQRPANPTEAATDNTRSAFHRYLGISRLANMTSSNSHVFGVWITVGMFNLDASGELADEVGFTDGSHERTRAFYMIDRTIPVRYEPGVDHDTARTIIFSKNLD